MIISDPAEKKAILDRTESLTVDAENKTSRIKACIYGPKGAGKSVLAVVLAKKLIKPGQSIVFVDTSEGWLSLRNHRDWGLLDGVQIIQYEGVEQLSVLAEASFKGIGKFANVGAIIFDDADFMSNAQLNDIWAKRVAKGGSTLDPDKPERPDYLKMQKQFMEVLDDVYVKTPDIHLILTAHAAEKKSTDGQVVLKVYPSFSPALSEDIARKQQMLVYLKAKEEKQAMSEIANYVRTVQVHPSANIDAKTRIGFDRVRVPYIEFINAVVEWSRDGGVEEDEKEALKRDIESKKVETDEDFTETNDVDDAPAFVG